MYTVINGTNTQIDDFITNTTSSLAPIKDFLQVIMFDQYSVDDARRTLSKQEYSASSFTPNIQNRVTNLHKGVERPIFTEDLAAKEKVVAIKETKKMGTT